MISVFIHGPIIRAMGRSGLIRNMVFSERMLMCLLALALLARALVPAGYMPDANALRRGVVELTFCIAGSEMSTLQVSLDDRTGQTTHQDGSANDCPFFVLAHQVLDMPVAAMVFGLPVVFAGLLAPFSLNRALPALPALGPPLGSRAPPFNLV